MVLPEAWTRARENRRVCTDKGRLCFCSKVLKLIWPDVRQLLKHTSSSLGEKCILAVLSSDQSLCSVGAWV